MTVSLWERSGAVRRERRDAVVLGAGVVGLSVLHALQERGVDAIGVERRGVGTGASTRNAGYLMRGAADNYAAAVRTWGRDVARDLWRLSEQNLADLRELGVESLASYDARASCLLAMDEGEAAELRESAALLAEDGFAVELRDSGAEEAWARGLARLALLNPNDAVVNPRELINHVRSLVTLPILEHTEVWAIDREGERMVLRARGLEIETPMVFCCLNALAPTLVPELEGLITPNRGQMLAIDDPRVRLPYAYYANHGSEYFRRADERTIVVGGWRKHFEGAERTAAETTSPDVQRGLERFAARVIGAKGPVIARWAGTMGFSATGLPLVTRLGTDPRIVLCAGFTGHGMSLGRRSARLAVEVALDGGPAPFPLPEALVG